MQPRWSPALRKVCGVPRGTKRNARGAAMCDRVPGLVREGIDRLARAWRDVAG